MPELIQPRTDRLLLRQWRKEDREPFSRLNGDPVAMEFFPKTLSRSESDAIAEKCEALIAERGWGFWAVELLGSGEFIGIVGLHTPSADLPCSPCVEVGWRLLKPYWGRGFATEAARESLRVGFELLGLSEIVSFTTVGNLRSRAVMERLNMTPDRKTFDHPEAPEESGLREHCLYRLAKETWALAQ